MEKKTQNETLEYNGYQIFRFFQSDQQWMYIIRELLPNGKYKVRRRSACSGNAGRDQYGRPLGYSYKNRESTLDNAKNYIDNHIKPWAVRLVELGRV